MANICKNLRKKNLHAMKIIPSKRRSIKSDIASKHPEISHTQNDPIIETRYVFQGPSFLGIHVNSRKCILSQPFCWCFFNVFFLMVWQGFWAQNQGVGTWRWIHSTGHLGWTEGFGLFRSSKAHVVGDTYPIQSMYGIFTARLLRLPRLRNRLGNGRRNPKPIPKFKTLNVECNSFFWYLWQVFWDLGQTKAPVGIFTYTFGWFSW